MKVDQDTTGREQNVRIGRAIQEMLDRKEYSPDTHGAQLLAINEEGEIVLHGMNVNNMYKASFGNGRNVVTIGKFDDLVDRLEILKSDRRSGYQQWL